MSNCKTVRLGDVCEIITGGTPSTTKKEYWANGTIPWLQSGVCQNCFVNKTETFITQEGLDNSSAKLMSKDTVLIALTGATTGKVGYLTFEACANQSVTGILPSKSFNQLYLYYCLLSKREKILSDSYGGAQKHISQGYVKNLEVQMPNIDKQNEIATILDEISNIITKHKLILEKYDTLIKSRFIEMFGDPVLNPKKWNIEKLKTLTSKIGSGATPKGGRESYISEGISLVRSMNVYKGYFEYDGLAHITEEQARELDNVTLQENDVLINITGASVARCCILPKAVLPARVNQHVSILRTTDKLNPVYLSNLLITDTEQRVLLGIGGAGGATREAITKTELETLDIPVPPMSLQNDFASFVQQIDKSKFEIWLYLNLCYIIEKRVFTYD
mgnify:CR=1 FL=1